MKFQYIWDIALVAALVVGGGYIWATRTTAIVEPAPLAAPAVTSLQAAPLPDRPAPDFTLAAVDGARVTLSDLRGQVVLINIWATWCPPCRAEMPAIQATYDRYAAQGFVVLAVNQQEDRATVEAYLREQGLTFPALLDDTAEVGAAYQARVLPSSFFVDRRGVIRAVYRGPMSLGVIEGTVAQLVAETP